LSEQAVVVVEEKRTYRKPWDWIPSLYFAEGLPYVMVMTVSVILYKRLGISNTDIALYTSWLYLPWTIKPLWSPFVDMFGTKRRWILELHWLFSSHCFFFLLFSFLPVWHLRPRRTTLPRTDSICSGSIRRINPRLSAFAPSVTA
jgi:MFS family permease